MCELVGCSSKGQAGRPSRREEKGLGRQCPAGKPPLYAAGHPGQPFASEPPDRRGSGSRVDLEDQVSDPGPPRRPVPTGLTREMVRGALKSRPPTRRKPQGEGPRRVTEWGIAGGSRSRSRADTEDRRRRRRRDAAPRPRPARPGPRSARPPPPLPALPDWPRRGPDPPTSGGSEDPPSAHAAGRLAPPPGSRRPRDWDGSDTRDPARLALRGPRTRARPRELRTGPLKSLLWGGAQPGRDGRGEGRWGMGPRRAQ